MISSSAVIIGSADSIDKVKARAGLGDKVLAFREAETLQALEAITKTRPDLVLMERLFAATPRGVALINRLRADPSLNGVEIRVVAHDSDYVRTVGRPAAAAAPAPEASPPGPAPFDYRGTRRAPRFRIQKGVEVLVDGDPATLVDLSTLGAQIVSSRTLRPDQRVRLSIGADGEIYRLGAAVAWAQFEMPPGRSQYRAGVEFVEPDVAALDGLCRRHRIETG